MNIFVNACARKDSRTYKLASALLEKLGDYETINLYDLDLKPIDEEYINKRNEYISNNDYSNEMFNLAKRISECDNLIIAAPFWDLSFPSILKVFIEHIYCVGVVTGYDENGMPFGMCKGNTVYYISTAGGPIKTDYGYEYIKDLFINYFGFKNSRLIYADMLDVVGYDSEEIVNNKIKEIIEND